MWWLVALAGAVVLWLVTRPKRCPSCHRRDVVVMRSCLGMWEGYCFFCRSLVSYRDEVLR